MTVKDYSIGSDVWNGLSKVVEESSELDQVLAKIIGCGGQEIHFDGTNLRDRATEEAGDLLGALRFFLFMNKFDEAAIEARASMKLRLFHEWNDENRKVPA